MALSDGRVETAVEFLALALIFLLGLADDGGYFFQEDPVFPFYFGEAVFPEHLSLAVVDMYL